MNMPAPHTLPALRRSATFVAGIPDAVVDGERTTVGVPMVGDPWISAAGGLMSWRQAQYATAMAQKQGLIGADASGLAACCTSADTVVFVAIGTRQEVARFTIPARVMAFNPHRTPLQLADQRSGLDAPSTQRLRMTAPRRLTPFQAAILRVLQAHGPMTSAMLAANHFVGRYASWSTPKLKALNRHGLVQPDEGRLRHWHLTPAGRAHEVASAGAA